MTVIPWLDRGQLSELRGGRLTSSNMRSIMTGTPKTLDSLARRLRNPAPFYHYTTSPGMPAQMALGQQYEPLLLARFWEENPWYEMINSSFIAVGDHLGCSPDSLLTQNSILCAGVEGKCHSDPDIWDRNVDGGWEGVYKAQVQSSLWMTGLNYWYFVVLEVGGTGRFFVHRVFPDRPYIEEMATRAQDFLATYLSGGKFSRSVSASTLQRMI